VLPISRFLSVFGLETVGPGKREHEAAIPQNRVLTFTNLVQQSPVSLGRVAVSTPHSTRIGRSVCFSEGLLASSVLLHQHIISDRDGIDWSVSVRLP
jgi:hypothetical protein